MGFHEYTEQQADEARTEERIDRRKSLWEYTPGYHDNLRVEYYRRLKEICMEEERDEQ